MRNRILSLYVLALATMLAASPNSAQARIAGGCTYSQCRSSCPSPSSHIEFCENYSIGAGCSIASAGCRPGDQGGCGPNEVYVYCNETFVE